MVESDRIKSSQLKEAADLIVSKLDNAKLEEIVGHIPDDWLGEGEEKEVYVKVLSSRIANLEKLLNEAQNAKDGNI